MAESNPIKLCECGCGRPTTISKMTRSATGAIKGQPVRFIRGHGKPRLRHGQSSHSKAHPGGGTREYRSWTSMTKRCTNPKAINYKDYGGRGIKVCERWRSFENFLADMGKCPEGFTIERLNNDGNYEPGNCVWADIETQNRNRRNIVRLTHDGKTMSMADWARAIGVDIRTLIARRRAGWTVSKILSPFLFDRRGQPMS